MTQITLTPQQVEELTAANLKNIVDKVAAGGVLSKRETELIREHTQAEPELKRGKGRPAHDMIRWSLQLAQRETGVHREMLERRRRAQNMERGGDGKFSTVQIIALVNNQQGPDGTISAAEAQRQLTIARKEQIELEMEVTRKERIPLEDAEAEHDRRSTNIAGLLKAHLGKTLDETLLGDIFAEFRTG